MMHVVFFLISEPLVGERKVLKKYIGGIKEEDQPVLVYLADRSKNILKVRIKETITETKQFAISKNNEFAQIELHYI